MSPSKTTPYLLLASLVLIALVGLVEAQDKGGKKKSKNTSGVPFPAKPSFPDKADAKAFGLAVAEHADLYDSGWVDQYSVGEMTLYDASNDSVVRAVLQLFLEGKSGDKSIIRFRSPAEVKGVAALTHEHYDSPDDSWLYLPASKRVRRISGANKTASFQGTEFTYEDLSSRIVVKYDWRFLGEEVLDSGKSKSKVYKVEAKPKYEDTGYSRLDCYFHTKVWRLERIDFYDKAGKLLKILKNSRWKRMHGRFWRALEVEMDNVQTKKRTVIRVKALLTNLSLYTSKKTGKPRKNLTDKNFTTRSLEGR